MACCTRSCCLTCGVIGFALLLLFGGLIYVITNPLIVSFYKAEVLVTSENSSFYADWACKFSQSEYGPCAADYHAVPFYEKYFLFNYTNVDDIVNEGAKPKVNELGPWAYRVNITKYDIQFLDGGNQISYGESRMYHFAPEESCDGCTPDDLITTMNPGYLGGVDTVGKETILILAMAPAAVEKLFDDIESTYIQDLINADGEAYWLEICQGLDADCASPRDMAKVQWGHLDRPLVGQEHIGLNNQRVNELLPEVFPYNVTEYSWDAVTNTAFTIAQINQMMYGEHGILIDPLHLLEMLEAMTDLDNEALEEKWGITLELATNFLLYVVKINSGYSNDIYEAATVLYKGGGMFSTRTIHEWIFDFADPLLLILQPGDPQTAIRHNDSSIEDAESYKPGRWVIDSGNVDFDLVANVIQWNGTDTVTFWPEPYPVWGNNQEGQFALQGPNGRGQFPETLMAYDSWSSDHGQTVYIHDIGDTPDPSYGIYMRRFLLGNETYKAIPEFYSPFEGFTNASSFHMDPPFRKRIILGALTPLFMSQPRFWAVPGDWASKWELMNAEIDYFDCATIVDVEPVSGNGMGAWKRLQVNWYINDTDRIKYNGKYSKVPQHTMYGSMYISQESFVTEELAEYWKNDLGIVINFQEIFFIVGLVAGSIGLVICAVALHFSKKSEKNKYQSIN